MTPKQSFAIAARLGLTTALTMFALIIVGSIVRTTGSGLACPDWPLCNGHLIPPFDFNVLMEWSHRFLALIVSLLLASTVTWIAVRSELRPRLLALAILAVALLGAQILLGALTVWKLLHPAVVGSHLGVALLLFSNVLILALVAQTEANEYAGSGEESLAPRPAGLLPLFGLVTALVYGQALLGGIVSTHHAGLVCPDWPGCNGELFPQLEGLVGLQMYHRFGAYALVVAMIALYVHARRVPDAGVRAGASMVLGLTLTQVVLGVMNVFLRTPVWLSTAHLATAAAILALMVVITFRVALMPSPRARIAMEAS